MLLNFVITFALDAYMINLSLYTDLFALYVLIWCVLDAFGFKFSFVIGSVLIIPVYLVSMANQQILIRLLYNHTTCREEFQFACVSSTAV